MEKVIYGNNQGLGIILNEDENIKDYVYPENVLLHGTNMESGSWTCLDGIFNTAVKYEGLLKNEKHQIMVFFIGVDATLFSGTSYYQCFYRISETRIANKYKEGTVRDFNWINNKWK